MIQGISPLAQATLGTLFTWALTAAGAAVVIIFHGTQRKLLDSSLGFAAGVMIAASYWSLLVPAIEIATDSKSYGEKGEYAFFPVTVGFLFGGLFVYLTDVMISKFSLCAPHLLLAMEMDVQRQMKKNENSNRSKKRESAQGGLPMQDFYESSYSRRRTVGPENRISETKFVPGEQKLRPYGVFSSSDPTNLNCYQSSNSADLPNPRTQNMLLKTYPKFPVDERRSATISYPQNVYEITNSSLEREDNFSKNSESIEENDSKDSRSSSADQWKRIVLLIIAITVHNIPEGLAVGVRFGAVGKSDVAAFHNARNLAIGIGIQNFPEGLAVSLPLRASGFSLWKSFWYGQLSGMVEPIFGALGAVTVGAAKPLLPFALSFAAGAMIYVVVDDIIPEANSCISGYRMPLELPFRMYLASIFSLCLFGNNGKLATWGTILGFIVMMVLEVGLGGGDI